MVVTVSRPTTRYAISPSGGCPLFYEVTGPPRPCSTVVLCDGIGCDGYVWKYLSPALSRTHRVVHWHYPGHGRSPRPDRTPTIPALAADVGAILDDCEVDRAVLVGHSMGVQVVLEAYRQLTPRVEGLVLMCGMAENPLKTFRGTSALEPLLPAVRAAVDRAPHVLGSVARWVLPTRLAFRVASAVEVNGALLDRHDFMPYLRGLSRVEPSYFLSLLTAAVAHSAVDLLPQIAVPTLVVAGERDGFTPPELSETIAGAIPGATLVTIRDGSHTAPLERPDEVNAAVCAFVDRLTAGGDRLTVGSDRRAAQPGDHPTTERGNRPTRDRDARRHDDNA
jgi:pimeloyl-ACP methyl ester carboxylesterase